MQYLQNDFDLITNPVGVEEEIVGGKTEEEEEETLFDKYDFLSITTDSTDAFSIDLKKCKTFYSHEDHFVNLPVLIIRMLQQEGYRCVTKMKGEFLDVVSFLDSSSWRNRKTRILDGFEQYLFEMYKNERKLVEVQEEEEALNFL